MAKSKKEKAKAADNGHVDASTLTGKKGRFPVKGKKDKNACLITVVFERETTDDEMETLKANYHARKISTDPEQDLHAALAEQLSLELQEAHEGGLAGFHQVKRVKIKRAFHRKKMGWKKGDTEHGSKRKRDK